MSSASVSKQKLSKKGMEALNEGLRLLLDEGQHIAFVGTSKQYDWKILITNIKTSIDGEILNVSKDVAGILERPCGGDFLRGFKYDSPELLCRELQEHLNLKKPFTIDLL